MRAEDGSINKYTTCHFELVEKSLAKSFIPGLIVLINHNFFSLRQSLICFSLEIASLMFEVS